MLRLGQAPRVNQALGQAAQLSGESGVYPQRRELTTSVVLLPNALLRHEYVEGNEDQKNASSRFHTGGNHDRGGHHRPANRCGCAQVQPNAVRRTTNRLLHAVEADR